MNLTIELPDESAARLQQQSARQGVSFQVLVQNLAREKADQESDNVFDAKEAVARILELQKLVKPDPQGWTVRDYIDHGRL
ncbi:MAG: hypothetical protein JNL98_23880 [Bryobacterales bacterium]|nr:hypothetical protein [Bryobacterales bacterium]